MKLHFGKWSATLCMLSAAAIVTALFSAGIAANTSRSPGHRILTVPGAPYPAAAIRPTQSRAAMDAAVRSYYEAWKAAFLRTDCGDETVQVYSPTAAFPHVAEGQAYGLMITAAMTDDENARTLFDGILGYVLAHPSANNPDLMAAEQDANCADAGGGDSATDGDMDIAYALLLADRRWQSSGTFPYRSLALKRIAAIKEDEVNPTTKLMLLGDWSTPDNQNLYATSRTSDWMVDHFRAFRAATADSYWDRVITAHQQAIATLQTRYSPQTGLLPDFTRTSDKGVEPVTGKVLESAHDGDYHYNACRVPWRIGLDAITSGDQTSLDAARKITTWAKAATGGDPDRLGSGYTLAGTRYGQDTSNAFWAPLAVAAMADPNSQAWLDALWAKMADSTVTPENYFGSTMQLQAMLIVSGRYQPA